MYTLYSKTNITCIWEHGRRRRRRRQVRKRIPKIISARLLDDSPSNWFSSIWSVGWGGGGGLTDGQMIYSMSTNCVDRSFRSPYRNAFIFFVFTVKPIYRFRFWVFSSCHPKHFVRNRISFLCQRVIVYSVCYSRIWPPATPSFPIRRHISQGGIAHHSKLVLEMFR